MSRVRGLSGGVAIGAITTLLLGIASGSWSLGAPAASVAVTGGYGGEQAVVRQLVGAIRPRTIADVRIGRPRYVGERREPRERTLFISVRSSRPAALARAWWEAGLLAAAARDLDRSRGLPAVGMVELFARAPDGRARPQGGIGVIPTGLAGPAPTPVRDATAVVGRIRTALGGQSGVHVVELAMLRPEGLAPVIRVRADDPPRFLRMGMPALRAAIGDQAAYDGVYIELDGRGGRPLEITTNLGRGVRSGSIWIHRGCDGFDHGVLSSQPVGAPPFSPSRALCQ